ncbi:MAG: tRNA (guanosine(46)-N7)-methyltransferase TrmB [Alphaproteobacteria bacterium]|nr:tRNA (guanosine(46)-N7)-methyltransferase TrmB [Alphaproteobacteria bacterium]
MSSASATQPKYLSSFGRNRGRSLRPYQQQLVDELLPTLKPSIESGYKRYALEIGFGAGEHLAAQAKHNPDTLYIGCEPYINGVAKLLTEIDQHKLKNIRLHTRDARELLEVLPEAIFDEIFVLFPDPWPKVRHNKRRLINQQTLSMLSRVHKKGGRLLVATDHVDYSAWILEHLLAHPDYEWTAKEKADWQTPPKDWTVTKYQRKTTEQGREPMFFECVKK